MKTILLLHKSVVICVTLVILSATAFSQSGNGLWQAIGNDSAFTNRQVKANKNLQVRGMLQTDTIANPQIEIFGNVNVTGKLTADSIEAPGLSITDSVVQITNVQVSGQITSENILVRGVLQVGDSGAFFWFPNFGFPQTDLYMTDIGRMAIGTGNAGGPTTFSSIKLGIGTTNPQFLTDIFGAGANGDVNISSVNFPTPANAPVLFPSAFPTYRYRGRPVLRLPGNAMQPIQAFISTLPLETAQGQASLPEPIIL